MVFFIVSNTTKILHFYLERAAKSISFTFFIIARGRRTFSLRFLASPTGDEHFFYIFYHRPRATNVFFTFFSFARGRRTFLLRFLASPAGEERSLYIFSLRPRAKNIFFILRSSPAGDKRSFFILLSSEPSDECSFLLFSVNPMLQRRSFSCFFSMGLISNSHRVERSTNFLIMKKRKLCRRPRLCGGCSCPACESIARQRQRICRAIARRLALDSCFTDARASWQKGAVEYYTCRLSL